jgi:gliding motility-associated-like protein
MKSLNFALFLFCSCFAITLSAQPTIGLVANFTFDNDEDNILIDQTGAIANNGFTNSLTYGCGVRGQALRLNGFDENAHFEGDAINDLFDTEDFSLSFYFKPLNVNLAGTQTIMSKRDDCSNVRAFAIRYAPATRNLNVILSENTAFSSILSVSLSPERCWYQITLVRKSTTFLLYIDGILVASDTKSERINLASPATFLDIGSSSCTTTDAFYDGFIDELLLYNRALTQQEVESIFYRPDMIGNGFVDLTIGKDTTLFLGTSVQAFVPEASFVDAGCQDEYLWEPAAGVSNDAIPNPVLEPSVSTTYTLSFTDAFNCVAKDTFRINVVDPNDLECFPYLPTAFTPNGDGLNEDYGIDNPFAVTDFISFEIFDRWGNLLFTTNDPFQRWDGDYKGEPINSGVYLYKVQYRCGGDERQEIGNVNIIR